MCGSYRCVSRKAVLGWRLEVSSARLRPLESDFRVEPVRLAVIKIWPEVPLFKRCRASLIESSRHSIWILNVPDLPGLVHRNMQSEALLFGFTRRDHRLHDADGDRKSVV